MRRHGLKAIGLTLMAAIGLMALTASAQAAEELTLKSRHTAILLNSGTFLKAGIETREIGKMVGTAILKIPGKNVEIRCEKGEVSEATVTNEADTKKNPEGEELTEGSISGLATMGKNKIQISKCKVFTESTGTEIAPCTKAFNENNPEKSGGEAAPTIKALLLGFLHFHKSTIAGEVLEHDIAIERLTPLGGGTTFTKLKFGGTCSLPESVEVKGSVATEVPTTDAVKQKAVFDGASAAGKAVSKDANTKLLFGASEAFIKGEIEAELEGSPIWGGM
jgi:hypothetical protein